MSREYKSLDEIRYWITRLLDEPMLGWAMDAKCLAKTLGFSGETRMKSMLWGSQKNRLTIGAQQRCSDKLDSILAGALVPRYHKIDGRWCGMAIVADDPKPLPVVPPIFGRVQITHTGVKLRLGNPAFEAPVSRIPTFKRLMGRN